VGLGVYSKGAWQLGVHPLRLDAPPTDPMNLVRTFAVCLLLVVTLTSCVAPAKVSEEKDANGKKIEYVYYTPTGSNLPIRVRKDQMQTDDSVTSASQKAVTDLQRESADDKSPSTGGR
jgi:hypothetical protein